MTKFTYLTAAVMAGLMVAAPLAYAATADDVASDQQAVDKDSTALKHDSSNVAANRAQKAKAKATGNMGSQAAASVKLGADHVASGEKSTEKNVDKNIEQNDKSSVNSQMNNQ